MFKKIFFAVLLCAMLAINSNVSFARDTFQTVAKSEYFSQELKNDEAVWETLSTPYGEMKFQFRKLANAGDDKRFHFIINLGEKRIFDAHYPKVPYGYTVKIIKNTADSRQFFVIQSVERAWLLGYSPENEKFEIYVDSANYKHDLNKRPNIGTLNNGDLILSFENSNYPISYRYCFIWDKNKNWFAYSDLGGVDYAVSKNMD